jgi:hypothetical protein|tara:strand:+ start:96 stop:989 length:894 start_codon:yes stop_codon:yes gene_type:complete
MHDVKDILTDIGYTLFDSGREYRAKPIYRDSSSNNVLCIKKDTGRWVDFKENKFGNLEELVQITLNLKDLNEAKSYISNNFQLRLPKVEKEKLKAPTIFSKKNLNHIIPDYSYWKDRGVSSSTLELFESGVMKSGRMKDRYVFPIFDKVNRLVGVAGRDVTNNQQLKWKLAGEKRSWAYPLKYNLKYLLEEKEVFLVESVGDMLALWEAGIKNCVVTFGLAITAKTKQVLMVVDPKKIYISFNNDENQAGNIAAQKAYSNLRRQFDVSQLEIKLPSKNDFGCMSKGEILKWKSQRKT